MLSVALDDKQSIVETLKLLKRLHTYNGNLGPLENTKLRLRAIEEYDIMSTSNDGDVRCVPNNGVPKQPSKEDHKIVPLKSKKIEEIILSSQESIVPKKRLKFANIVIVLIRRARQRIQKNWK